MIEEQLARKYISKISSAKSNGCTMEGTITMLNKLIQPKG